MNNLDTMSDENLVHDLQWKAHGPLPMETANVATSPNAIKERACFAYESSLLELATLTVTECKVCSEQLTAEVTTHGTAFVFKWVSLCSSGNHGRTWFDMILGIMAGALPVSTVHNCMGVLFIWLSQIHILVFICLMA